MKKLSLYIIPVQLFLAAYWFKNGFLDKVVGISLGIIHPKTAYYGLTWGGWHDNIVGSWDKSRIGHLFFSPFFTEMENDILKQAALILARKDNL